MGRKTNKQKQKQKKKRKKNRKKRVNKQCYTVSVLPTHLGFLHVIGQTYWPVGFEGLQRKSAYCAQFLPSTQLLPGTVKCKICPVLKMTQVPGIA